MKWKRRREIQWVKPNLKRYIFAVSRCCRGTVRYAWQRLIIDRCRSNQTVAWFLVRCFCLLCVRRVWEFLSISFVSFVAIAHGPMPCGLSMKCSRAKWNSKIDTKNQLFLSCLKKQSFLFAIKDLRFNERSAKIIFRCFLFHFLFQFIFVRLFCFFFHYIFAWSSPPRK